MRTKMSSTMLRLNLVLAMVIAAFALTPAVLAGTDAPEARAAISDCNSTRTGTGTQGGAATGAGGAAAGAGTGGSAAGAGTQGGTGRGSSTPVPGPVLTVKTFKAAGAAGAATGSASTKGSSKTGGANLTWTDAGRGSVQEYQVWYGSGGGRVILNNQCRVVANTFQASIGGLSSGSTWAFQVVAIGVRGGKNRSSSIVTVKIP